MREALPVIGESYLQLLDRVYETASRSSGGHCP
jgi:hypothetical protein